MNIAISYYHMGNNLKAIKYTRIALSMYNSAPKDEETLSNLYNNLGTFYGQDANYSEAKKYFGKAFDLDKKANDFIGQAYIYNNLGTIESFQKKYNEALIYYEKSLELKVKYGTNQNKSDGYKQIGSAYYNMKKQLTITRLL
jgi:tetratricopeptide (TPR) repeat protein